MTESQKVIAKYEAEAKWSAIKDIVFAIITGIVFCFCFAQCAGCTTNNPKIRVVDVHHK